MYFKEINVLASKSVKIKSNPNNTKKNYLKKRASHLKISLKIHVSLGSHDNSLLDYYLHLTNEDN